MNFYFTLLCGASKVFMKALEAFIKRFEAPEGSVKITIYLNFISIQLSKMHGTLRVNLEKFTNYLNSKHSKIKFSDEK